MFLHLSVILFTGAEGGGSTVSVWVSLPPMISLLRVYCLGVSVWEQVSEMGVSVWRESLIQGVSVKGGSL